MPDYFGLDVLHDAEAGLGVDAPKGRWLIQGQVTSMKLSWISTAKYTVFTKWIDTIRTGKPECFYLGTDESEADLKAIRLTLAYKKLKATGATCWTDAAIEAALVGSRQSHCHPNPDNIPGL